MDKFILYACQPLGFLVQMFPPAWMLLYSFRGQYRCPFRRVKGILAAVLLFLTFLFTAGTLYSYFSGSDRVYLIANLIFGLCLTVCLVVFSMLTTAGLIKQFFAFLMMLNYACFVLTLSNIFQETMLKSVRRLEQLPYVPTDILMLSALSLVLSPVFYFIICRRYLKREWNIQEKGWNILLAAQLVYFFLACILALFTDILIGVKVSSILLGLLLFSEIVMYTIAFRLLELSQEKYETELDNERMRQNMRLQEQQYESMKETMELARKQRHDLEHHFALLSVLSQKEENLPKIREYLEEYLSESAAKGQRFCDNYTVNALLNYYMQLAEEKGIVWQAQVSLPEGMKIKDIHLSILFGNALKNALEACTLCREQGKEAEEWLQMRAGLYRKMFIAFLYTE